MEEKLQSAGRAAEQLPVVMQTTTDKPKACSLPNQEKSSERCSNQLITTDRLSQKETSTSSAGDMLKSSKHVFSPQEINELKLSYSDEICSGSISMAAVQEKQKLQKCSSLSTRQIYDKLRQLIKEQRHVGGPVLPVETLSQKIERMDHALSCSSDSYPNFIPPSISSNSRENGKFLTRDVLLLNEVFNELTKKGSCKDADIKSALLDNEKGNFLSKKYSLSTIKNRIKYKIRKKKSK